MATKVSTKRSITSPHSEAHLAATVTPDEPAGQEQPIQEVTTRPQSDPGEAPVAGTGSSSEESATPTGNTGPARAGSTNMGP